MKKFILPNFNFIGQFLNTLCFYLLLNINGIIFSQTPIVGPGMQWYKEQWYDNNGAISQSASGEDWYYDLIPYFESASVAGFTGFGFSSIVNDNGDFTCIGCGNGDVEPNFFERSGYEKGCSYPKIAEMDEKGNIEWYSVFTDATGYFRAGVQLDDESGYAAVGSIRYDGGMSLTYNYDVATSTVLDHCVLEEPDEGETNTPFSLIYVVKTNEDGVLINDAAYGLALPVLAGYNGSEGYGIIQDVDDHNLIIVGYAFEGGYLHWDDFTHEFTFIPGQKKAYVAKIDIDDLSIIWFKTLWTGDYESHATCVIESDNEYYVAGTKDYDTPIPSHGKINIARIEYDGSDDGNFEITSDPDIDDHFVNSCSEDPYVISTSAPYNAEAAGKVYRIDITGTMSLLNTVPLIIDEDLHMLSYDLKIGLTNTFDDGYAVVTSVHDPSITEFDDCGGYYKTYYPGNTYTFTYGDTRAWNADAYVAKFDSGDDMLWNATYPLTNADYSYSVMFPQDIKREECLYEIFETPDHGLVLGGNNSINFDDDLVIKIFNDCNRYVSYNTGAGDINVNGITTLGDETWNSSKKVRGIVEVPDDVTLTITNDAVIQFADSKADNIPTYIVVRRGGRLIIEDGAKLTGNTECGTMWEGIYVEGTFGTNQPSVNSLLTNSYYVVGDAHGIVKITGDATIENARRGITLGMSPLNDEYPDYDGGIVIADGANFINNTVDIFFWPFDKSEVSFIRNSNFITNAALVDNYEVPEAHIEMIQVKNVNMRGNNFENSSDISVYNGTDRGIGILSFNGTYIANDNPNAFGATGATGTDPNYFTDMYYGIYAAQYTSLGTNIVIDGNIIEDNGRGIYLGGTSLAEVNRNTFILPEKSNYALYLDASTGYGVEENIFNGSGADHPHSQAGVVVNESGTAPNILYRNTFNDIKYASRVQGNNGNTSTGLELKCNTFEDNMFDISLVSSSTTATMKKEQGTCGTQTSPANNLFTDPSFADTQIKTTNDVATDYYKYSFHEDLFPLLTPFAAPASYSSSIDPKPDGPGATGCPEFPFNIGNFDTYCPTNFSSGGGSGRMANPGRVKPKNGLFLDLTYNPYEYLKTDGKEYEEFLDQISFNMLASYYMQNNYNDSLFDLLQNGTSVLAQSILAQIAIDSSNYTEANEIATEIAEDTLANEEGFSLQLQNISTELAEDTLTWLDLNNEQLTSIHEIAVQENREGIQAKLLLELIDGINYEEPINPLNEEVTEEEVRQIQTIYPPSELNSINIYPHPVSNGSIVEIHIDNAETNTRFIITDLQGRYIMQFPVDEPINYIKLNNTILKAGVYTGYITCNGCDRLSTQIVVIK